MLKKGYKQTDVGVIPEEWEVRPLLSAVRIANGQVDPATEPYRSMILIAPDHVESSTGRLLAKITAGEQGAISGKYVFGPGDIIYSKIRPYLCKAVLADCSGLCSADMYPLRAASDVSAGFILAVILGHRFSKYAESVSARSGMPKINRAEMADYSFALPPLSEQRAIAEALGDVDGLIGSLEAVIAKKRAIKLATMQQLLTGKTRLPGFEKKKGTQPTDLGPIPNDWEVKRLGDIAPFQRGFDLPAKQTKAGEIPVVCSNGVEGYNDRAMARGPGVVTGRSGTLGKVHYIVTDYWPHNTTLWITDFKGNSPKFIYYLYDLVHLDRFAAGSGVPTLNRNDVHAFRVLLPPALAEQSAIAGVLSDMDGEIEAAERRLAKYRMIKQGMMQELLTGRIRLR